MYIDGDTHYWPTALYRQGETPRQGPSRSGRGQGRHGALRRSGAGQGGDLLPRRQESSLLQRRALEHCAARRVHEKRRFRQAGLDSRQPAADLRVRCRTWAAASASLQRHGGRGHSGRRSFHRLRLDLFAGHQGIRERTAARGEGAWSESGEVQRRLGRRRLG